MNRFWMTAAAICLPTAALVAQAPMSASTYVMKAGASDQYEMQSSKLVLATTTNPAVKQFATMMVTDHTKSTADVKAAAKRSKLMPKPPKLDPQGMKDVAALKATTGAARDTLYVDQQKLAHQQALALHSGYADSGSAPALKSVAATITPVVQHHIDMLASM